MEEEVEKHKLTRDSLEFELQALKERMLTVENFTEIMGSDNSDVDQQPEDQLSRSDVMLAFLLQMSLVPFYIFIGVKEMNLLQAIA